MSWILKRRWDDEGKWRRMFLGWPVRTCPYMSVQGWSTKERSRVKETYLGNSPLGQVTLKLYHLVSWPLKGREERPDRLARAGWIRDAPQQCLARVVPPIGSFWIKATLSFDLTCLALIKTLVSLPISCNSCWLINLMSLETLSL